MPKINGTSGNNTLHGTGLDDLLYGYGGSDLIYGHDGNDTLDGGAGKDTMIGGKGDDLYYVDSTGDQVTENAGEGTDAVVSSITYTLGANVEYLDLTGTANINGTGNSLNNIILGNSGMNSISGLYGNDILDGGAGNDRMVGGMGDDFYFVDSAGDVVTETAGEGTDWVYSFISYTLGADIENLSLAEGTTSINGTGNGLNNEIYGNDGDNILDGGASWDYMVGGAGNDTYMVDHVSDSVVEAAGGGTDVIYSSATHTLEGNVEALRLTGTGNINGTGNSLDNPITGNSGNNTLDGGTGSDTMAGGAGNDAYVVDSSGDIVTERVSEGTDLVNSSGSYTLRDNIENLALTGTANISGIGNGLNNVITGNSGNNTLSGRAGNDTLNGGAGSDTMVGGTGNDIYIVNTPGDIVTENTGEGLDTVKNSVTYTLGANTENLTLTGTGSISGTGNDLNNTITGNSGGNTLSGGAGNDILNGWTGSDTMAGGAGDDLYVADNSGDLVTELAGEGIDTVNSSISFTLGGNIENLTLTGMYRIDGTGNGLDNTITGNSGINTLSGGAGNDTLSGGENRDTLLGGTGNDILMGGNGFDDLNGETGNDTMAGGQDSDRYWVDSSGDLVIEHPDEGRDWVYSPFSYTLGANIEGLALTGTADINGTGNSLDNSLDGNRGNNILIGGAGNDLFAGGAGADTLIGGVGDDEYEVTIGDVITENPNEGIDVVYSQGSYSLERAPNVEILILMGSGAADGSEDFNGTGNALDNVINGNAGDNILRGRAGNDVLNGGGGHDTLTGGPGSDTFVYPEYDWNPPIAITDFTLGAGNDLLDLTSLCIANTDYLLFTYDSTTGNTTIAVDWDGAGGYAPVDRVILEGVHMTSEDTDNYIA